MTESYSLKVLLLGAERGIRRLDFTKSYPTALQDVGQNRHTIDWILTALKELPNPLTAFVGGYHIEKMVQLYPDLHYFFHEKWYVEGELAAVLLAKEWLQGDGLICRASIVVLPQAMRRLSKTADAIVVGYFSHGAPDIGSIFSTSESQNGVTSVAFIRFRGIELRQAIENAQQLHEEQPDAGLEEWVTFLTESGLPVTAIDVSDCVAPVHTPSVVARLIMGNKAQTLDRLRPILRNATILDQVRFTVSDWLTTPLSVLARAQDMFGSHEVVVRSSSQAEDQWSTSQAGHFQSILDVRADDENHLRTAINTVVSSFSRIPDTESHRNAVFIQLQVKHIRASGVLFTRDIETGAPYFLINIDRQSQRSDVVTSGRAGQINKAVVYRGSEAEIQDTDIKRLVQVAREIEGLAFHDALDIEFAIDQSDQLFILQVRPLIVSRTDQSRYQLADEDLTEELRQVGGFLDSLMQPVPYLYGERTLLGTMPDWNPAEMIGTAPRPLALSLYQNLIGDQVWAEARAQIGYLPVVPTPLILSLAGRPYVDVRTSLNSFLPDDLPPPIAEKLIEAQLRLLSDHPELHDKIEFEIGITCLSFDFEQAAQRFRAAGLSSADLRVFKSALLKLTDGMLTGEVAPVTTQLALLEKMKSRRDEVLRVKGSSSQDNVRTLAYLLEDCKRFGTLPFSVLARYAFVSLSFLRSLRTCKVLSTDEYELILRSIPTVASDLARDIALYTRNSLSLEEFLTRYGHLRPSSYDLTSPNYASAAELYLSHDSGLMAADIIPYPDISKARELLNSKRDRINALLIQMGFRARADHLIDFILSSIPGREYAKFEFMKNVNAILEHTAQIGESFRFSRSDMSCLPIDRLLGFLTGNPSAAVRTELLRDIEFGKKRWNLTCSIQLPYLINQRHDIEAFEVQSWLPNFVTTKRVLAPTIALETHRTQDDLAGKIVLIESADPGYDWIFAHPIAGLVTQYGGAASHMAIRAAEFGLPSAIGCGEIIYNRVRQAKLIELNCAEQQIRIVR